MRVRAALAVTVAGAVLVAASTSTAVRADPVPPAMSSGPMVVWGSAAAGAALAVPDDLTAAGIRDVAATDHATAVVTADGRLRVWGESGAGEAALAPNYIVDAVAVSLTGGNGAVITREGMLSAWGSEDVARAPEVSYGVSAISLSGDTGYYVETLGGFVKTWGAAPPFPVPSGDDLPAGMVDVSAGPSQVLALRRIGTVQAWGDPSIPELNAVPDLGGLKVTQIATGPGANGVILADGSIRIWGPGVPTGQPDLTGQKVVSLALGTNVAGAVTDDGVVHTWGSEAAVNAVPGSLTGLPATGIAVGAGHAAVIVAYRKLSEVAISGTPQVGQTYTANPATYSLTPTTIRGQWLAEGHPIKDQTGRTLTVDGSLVGSSISYRETAIRNGITWTSTSAAIGPVARVGSTTTLIVTPATAVAGRARLATATVTGAGGTPTGTVTFRAGARTRVVTLSEGRATWMLPRFTRGSHPITATYSGSPSSDPSDAAPVSAIVTKATSRVTAKAAGTARKLHIFVSVRTAKSVSAAGRVTVRLGGRTLKAPVDANGQATLTIKKVKHGTYRATVRYAGNASVTGSKGSVRVRA